MRHIRVDSSVTATPPISSKAVLTSSFEREALSAESVGEKSVKAFANVPDCPTKNEFGPKMSSVISVEP